VTVGSSPQGTVAPAAKSALVARYLRPTLVVVLLAAIVVVVFRSGLVDAVRDEEQLRSDVERAGVLGPLLFLGLMVLLVPLNVPGIAFVLPATTLFGTAGGIALSLLGGYAASVIGVLGARWLGRSAFEARIPPRVRRVEQRLSAHGFWGVVALRSCTFLMQPVDWLCGISSIPTRTVLTATFIGLIPPTLVLCLGGDELLSRVL
jgi:uncharacterized membrane protein YdjX (TVP38/TMEM64 family)